MAAGIQPRYSREEFARRGEELFDQRIAAQVASHNAGEFVLIDIETGDFEVDADEMAASDRLLARHPDAQVWMRCVGSRYSRHFGGHRRG